MSTHSHDLTDWSFATGEIVGRLVDVRDRAFYRLLYGDPAVMAHVGPVLCEEAADRLLEMVLCWNAERPVRARYWLLQRAHDGAELGVSAIVKRKGHYEVGVMILPRWHRMGIGIAATRELISGCMSGRWGDGFDALSLSPMIGNVASRRLCEKLGFDFAGDDGARLFWRLTRKRWLATTCETKASSG